MDDRRKKERRTGAIFLTFVAATNVVLWMELVSGAQAFGEPAASSEIRLALASCFLAAVLALSSWLAGRRPSSTGRLSIPKARTLGLRLALVAAALNLISVAGLLLLRSRLSPGLASALPLIAGVWYLVALPVQLVAAYATGRGSQAGDRRGSASPPPPSESPGR